MKKFCAVWIALLFVFLPLAAPVQAVISTDTSGGWPGIIDQQPAAPFDYDFQAPSANWLEYVADELPATFSADKIHYELADSVIEIDSQVTSQLATAGQLLSGAAKPRLRPDKIIAEGGYIAQDLLQQAAQARGRSVENGSIFVDTTAGTAFKVVSPSTFTGAFAANETLSDLVKPLEDTYSVARPQLSEVVKSFELEEDTIRLTRGNISGFAPGIEQSLVLPGLAQPQAFGDALKDFKYLSDDPFVKLQFTDQTLEANLGGGGKVQVTVSGGLGIEDIDLTGRYSGFDGYRIELTLRQESYLVVEMGATVKQEVYIPLLGLDIPFGVGRISGGIFAVIGLDGSLSLEIEARDYTETTMGVRGGTKFYVPTSVKPIFKQGFTSDGDVDLNGDIDGYLKFGPMMGLELFGFDLVGAGVFLGAGVHVQADNKMLDVNLYGLFNVYVKLAGENFNLANYKPTILRRRQANTLGYRIKVVEAFISPGLVGGTIENQVSAAPPKFEVAQGLDYRILVVPDGVFFDPNDAASVNQAEIRKYPASGYATTNGEGEFYQHDPQMLYHKDQVIIEFRVKGESYYSNPASPTLPFSSFTIAKADSFNDFVTGQVNPIRSINWEAAADAPPEEQYQWTYCSGALVNLSQYLSLNYNQHVPTGHLARAMTDEWGNFDTRKPPVSLITGQPISNDGFDVHETPSNWGNMVGYDVSLNYHEATTTGKVPVHTTLEISFDRTIQQVPGSFKTYEENGKIINQVQYDESIWIVNPNGTRTVTSDEFRYNRVIFSTQDLGRDTDYRKETDLVRNYQWVFGESGKQLIPLLDSEGRETGAALFKERVTVEWVWQAHPNPVTVTSADHTTVNQQGGTFPVTASGFAPFRFTLAGAPTGIQIGAASGQLQIPASMDPGDYTFTIQAEEDRSQAVKAPFINDPYQGHAPSPPDEQVFTLTISNEPGATKPTETSATTSATRPTGPSPSPTPVPTPTPAPSPEPTPTPVPRTPPEIEDADHDYTFVKLIGSGDYEVQIEAAGSKPITWTLERFSDRYPYPETATIDEETGLLTLRDGMDPGTYYFVIRASNDVGSDTRECTVNYLELVRPTLPLPTLRQMAARSDELDLVQDDSASQLVLLATQPGGSNWSQTLPFIESPEFDFNAENQPAEITLALPLNTATIRYDHPQDIYTRDRDTLNGAHYVHWHACPGVMTPHDSGVGIMIFDEAPQCDNYHYFDKSAIPPGLQDKLEDVIRDQASLFNPDDFFLGAPLDRQDLIDSIDAFVINPLDSVTYLDYGSILSAMAGQDKGKFDVDLDDSTGTFVAGELFTGLKETPQASLAFNQTGATIAFAGRDVQGVDADTALSIFDFGFAAGALNEKEMLSAAGLTEAAGDAFVYSFGYHGNLPGIATFAIETGFGEGQKVQVYRYDDQDALASSGSALPFTLIASDIAVGKGGLVTYKNNTMSEYLVTTKKLAGAAVSEMVELQDGGEKKPMTGWIIGGAVGLLLLASAGVMVWRRRRV